ncbi:WSC domain-containing protein [Echria macrotheca]|uniref:WSC domain-containing protein n=1 Tax=Echria macrotheca TaxID=438768 RepID=A0AAJ0B1Y2_9PEZI|nr:WSC domain-containing protein [Echria macrotheca]
MKFFFAVPLAALASQVTATTLASGSSSTSATPSTSIPRPNTWTALGCYSQDAAHPVLDQKTTGNDNFMSIGLCTTRCADGNFPFAGLQGGNVCWCGTKLSGDLAKDKSACNVPCAGYALDTCGGANALNVLKIEGIDVPVPSTTITTAPPATSTFTKPGTVITAISTAGAMRNFGIFGW